MAKFTIDEKGELHISYNGGLTWQNYREKLMEEWKMTEATMDVKELAQRITLTVKLKRLYRWAWRVKIAAWLIQLAAWVMWMDIDIEFETEEDHVNP